MLYAEEDLAAPGGPLFQLNLNTGPRMAHHVAYDAHDDPRFWFTIDVSIARQGGRALVGPPAAVFPEPPRQLLATAVLDALDFYAGAPDAMDQALLSACRAWAWVVDGVWRSKGDSARWAMRRLPDPHPIERALRRRDGKPADPPGHKDVDLTLASARAALAAVARVAAGETSAADPGQRVHELPTGGEPGDRRANVGRHGRGGAARAANGADNRFGER